MTDAAELRRHPGWTRAQRAMVALFVVGTIGTLTALGSSFLAMQRLEDELNRSNVRSNDFFDVTRLLGRLELAIVEADSLDDATVEQAAALVERPFRVAMHARGDSAPEATSTALLEQQLAAFRLMASTRPSATTEARALVALAERTSKAIGDAAETERRDSLVAQMDLASGVATRTGIAATAALLVNVVLLWSVRRRFRSTYATAYEVAVNRTEELERSNAELVIANETKRRFVSMVSHELRTPLTVIRGFGETLMRHSSTLPQDQRDKLATAIVRQARRQQRMIEDLLVVASHADHAPEPEPTAFEVADLVEALVADLQPELASRLVVASDPLVVWADPRHVEQIIENLLTNAGKYGGPTIWVAWESCGNGQVSISVEDDGAGVPEQFALTMFDEFSQAEGGDARVLQGVGLGLSITRTLALANGGSVEYAHRIGGGARFELRLPAAAGVLADEPGRGDEVAASV